MKTVLITGASTGIGFATAVSLADRSYLVFAGARKKEDLDKLSQLNSNIVPLELDVTNSQHIEKAFELIQSQNPESFYLVNNAGIAVPGPIEAIPMQEFKKQFMVNVFGLVEVTQAFLPLLQSTKGRIINISSISGLIAMPFLGAYSASKFAVEAISDSLRRETAQMGVGVFLIEPGPIQTPIWEKGLSKKSELDKILKIDILNKYEPQFSHFISLTEKASRSALPVQRVVDKITEAIENESPAFRVVVGSPQDHLRGILARWLPTRTLDGILSFVLNRK